MSNSKLIFRLLYTRRHGQCVNVTPNQPTNDADQSPSKSKGSDPKANFPKLKHVCGVSPNPERTS